MDCQPDETNTSRQERRHSLHGRRMGIAALTVTLAAIAGVAVFSSVAIGTNAGSTTSEASTQQESAASEASARPDAQTADKDEVIYTKLDASGNKTGIYAVNEFQTDEATRVLDTGDYTSVQNLSTTESIVQNGTSIEMTTLAGKPTYYEGYMDASTQMPWDISITYYLDGTAVDPTSLYGANGDLEIVLDIEPIDDDSSASDFANSFVLQAQGTFPNDSFTVEDAQDATKVQEGSSTMLTYLLLPGEGGSYHIKGKATDFEYSGWQIAGMSLSLSLDLADQDTSELSDASDELGSATTSLSDGASSLADGIGSIASGTASGASGASELDSGAKSLQSGTDAFSSGLSDIDSGASSVDSGARELADGLSTLDESSSSLTDGWNAISGGIDTLSQSIASAQEDTSESSSDYEAALQAYTQAATEVATELSKDDPDKEVLSGYVDDLVTASATLGSLKGANGALSTVASGVAELNSGASQFDGGLTAYLSGVGRLSSGASQLASGTSALSSGVSTASDSANELASGAASLSSGTSSLASGLATLEDGSNSAKAGADALSEGSAELAESVSGLDSQILDSLQAKIDEKLGRGFQLHSFVDSANTNVSTVEFVYVTDGVEEPDDEEEEVVAEDSDDESILDRIVALFTGGE